MSKIIKLYIVIGKVKVLVCTRQWRHVDGDDWISLGQKATLLSIEFGAGCKPVWTL
jgi:hypothetical protein